MDKHEQNTPEARMKERREHPVLSLHREDGEAVFRYLVAVTDDSPKSYSIYAEYSDGNVHTTGEIPHFSEDRDLAEGFCCMLDRFSVTPLSLDSVYEDIYTP